MSDRTAADQGLPLADLIALVRSELLEASRAGQDLGQGQELRLIAERVELELEVTTERRAEGGGGLRIWVVEANGKASQGSGHTQRLKLTLVPETGLSERFYVRDPLLPDER